MQNKLPLAKDRNTPEIKPDKKAYLQTCEVASTPRSADHMLKKVKEKIPELVTLTEGYRDRVHAERYRDGNPFLPQSAHKSVDTIVVLSDFQNYQKNLCKSGLQILLKNITGEIKIDWAVSELSEMVRRFQEDGKNFPAATAAAMDQVLNYLLANKNMVSKNGVIYEAIDGKISEVDGQPVKANKEKIAGVMNTELPKFLKDNNLPAASEQHKSTTPAAEVKVKPMPEPVKPAAPAPSIDAPEAPSTGISSSR